MFYEIDELRASKLVKLSTCKLKAPAQRTAPLRWMGKTRKNMSDFIVTSVVDGDTFCVKGGWQWQKKDGSIEEGDTIRPVGYNTPESGKPGFEVAKAKLSKLINGKTVMLKNPVNISYGRLVCDVYYDGKNLADYFPEYKV